MEHNPFDVQGLQDALQYLLNRKQIFDRGIAGAGGDADRARAGQRRRTESVLCEAGARPRRLRSGLAAHRRCRTGLQRGGLLPLRAARRPRTCTSRPACAAMGPRRRAATGDCRSRSTTRKQTSGRSTRMASFWCSSCARASRGVANLDDILTRVPGIGCVLIGEGDLSQELGFPRQYDHPRVHEAMEHVVATCKKHNVPVGHPHVTSSNVERVLAEGYPLHHVGAGSLVRGDREGEGVLVRCLKCLRCLRCLTCRKCLTCSQGLTLCQSCPVLRLSP